LGRTNNANTAPSREVEQPFVTKDVQCADHGVLVYAEHGRQVDGWWKTFTLRSLTFGDGSSDLCGNLIV
jgi:hypothetical protein